ncbi:MAG: bifunctional acetate--CoA ligase family protein/GNAT family N-acetyltransferase [Proteobacteria bacterium]|nr:bifunctional acetate--CoA ligase family protein/GNAT family N-acetyltransferase [Pseudomonadota bacterium]
MSIRHIDDLFEPASVAVIGATMRPGSVGATVWRNVRHGRYQGPCWPVNRRQRELDGDKAYASVAELPAAPALAVICTPADTVPGLIAELGAKGTRAAVVITAGFTSEQKQAMLDAARPYVLRVLGPNGIGLLSPPVGLNASFAHADIGEGGLAFVSQSGALVGAMLDWARGRGIGFSRFVSLGDRADVDFGDMLDWLASDSKTRAILMYAESLSAPRKFMSAARSAARNKPVLLVKAGRSSAGQRAAASHTGALAGSDLVIDAAVRRAGLLRVDTLQDLFVAAETLAYFRGPARGTDLEALSRVTLLTNGGGAGVLAADAAAALGVELAVLAPSTIETLSAGLPFNWSRANPVDIIGDAPVDRYVHTLETLLSAPEAGSVLFMHAPTAIVPATDIARAIVPVARSHPGRLVSCWLGDGAVAEARKLFHDDGIPTYETPEQAVHALAMLGNYHRHQQMLLEAPPARGEPGGTAPTLDAAAVRKIIDDALAAAPEPDTAQGSAADKSVMLTEPEAKALLAACGIPVVPTRVVSARPEAAAAAASALGFPVVIKILSPQITHKTDVGGVALDLESPADVSAAASAMLARVARQRPDAVIEGFTLQPMVRRPQAIELIAGTHVDSLFGPVLLFGAGGTRVEVVADRAIALPPLNEPLARALVARTHVARLLAGWRDVPPADMVGVCSVLIALAQLLAEEARIAEIDINPLLADAQGVIALDARVRVSTAAPGGAERFAIRPYPAELVESFVWSTDEGTRTVTMRPIRPEDGAQHLAFLERLEPEDIRMRVFYSRRTIEPSELARLAQIDYEREMAFIATAARGDGQGEETLGVVRVQTDPSNIEAEFGILVRSDLKGSGLGHRLLAKMIDYLRKRGTERLVATVLRENQRMFELAKSLGMEPSAEQPDTDTVRLEMALR